MGRKGRVLKYGKEIGLVTSVFQKKSIKNRNKQMTGTYLA